MIIILLVSIIGCSGGDNSSKASQEGQAASTSNSAQATGPQIPGVPKDLMVKLWNECTYLDYIFHDLPFSMSQDEQPSIRANINYISTEPLGQIPSDCKAIGRQFFHIGGDIVAEANVYYSNECKFYVFVDGETPLYANKMSEEGNKFFLSMIQQAMQASGVTPQ